MKFDRKDIVTGLVVLVILVGGYYWLQQDSGTDEPLPTTPIIEENLEESFNIDIPDDVEKAELSDATGEGSTGIATRKFEAGTFESMVLADLPEPEAGQFYQAWLKSGDEYVSLGTLRVAKGGWISEFSGTEDLSDKSEVVVSLETTQDSEVEEIILQGSF